MRLHSHVIGSFSKWWKGSLVVSIARESKAKSTILLGAIFEKHMCHGRKKFMLGVGWDGHRPLRDFRRKP